MVTVVNKRSHKPTPYDYYIGRPSPLGNPFPMRAEAERIRVIQQYKEWLYKAYNYADPDVLVALGAIQEIEKRYGNVNLVCWCAPRACHGDIIKELLLSKYKTKEDYEKRQE